MHARVSRVVPSPRALGLVCLLLPLGCYAPPQTVEESRQPAQGEHDAFTVENEY